MCQHIDTKFPSMAFTNFTVLGWTVFSLLGQTTIVWLNWDYYQVLKTDQFLCALYSNICVDLCAVFFLTLYIWLNKEKQFLSTDDHLDIKTLEIFCTTYIFLSTCLKLGFLTLALTIMVDTNNVALCVVSVQQDYGEQLDFTNSLDRIQSKNKCCGVRNALLEYKESRWFINQRYSPRLYLPASCTESENQLQNNRIILMGCREVIQQETLRGNTVICALSAVSAIIYSVYVRKMLKSHSAKRYEVV